MIKNVHFDVDIYMPETDMSDAMMSMALAMGE